MLDWQLFGAKAGGHHFTNVGLHTIAVILLFFVLRQMTGSLWRSAFVAAIFAIHPLRAESVAWISERKDVLSGVFFMLTLVRIFITSASRPHFFVICWSLSLCSRPDGEADAGYAPRPPAVARLLAPPAFQTSPSLDDEAACGSTFQRGSVWLSKKFRY